VAIFAGIIACSTRTPTARERALTELPSTAQLVAAADGAALASPTFRRLLDVARPHVPAKLGCVIDAAQTCEAIALAVDLNVGTTIVIITHAVVASCPALSRIGDDRYIATVGDGAIADAAKSVAVDARWARARPYLVRDPVALAINDDRVRVIAVAQPEPVDAWLTIDSVDIAAIERDARAMIARWQAASAKLIVTRANNQLAVHTAKLGADELVMIVTDLLKAADSTAAAETAPVFTCPNPGHGITSCTEHGTRYQVTSIRDTLRALAVADAEPVIESGAVIGVQLTKDADVLLTRGDIILGLDSQRITNQFQLRELARHVGDHAALAVRRGTSEVVIELRE
jgi:hypothetical protein